MTMEFNVFNIAKQPRDEDEGIVDMNLIEELLDYNFHLTLMMILYKHVNSL